MAARAAARPQPLVQAGEVPLLFLDANILLPEYLRSVFLDLADADLVRVHWSEPVLAEVRRNLLKPRFGLSTHAVDRLFTRMASAFPDALVHDIEAFEHEFTGKTDPKDTHVAAGAAALSRIHRGASVVLVSANTRHLPQSAFEGWAIRSAGPGTVLESLLVAQPTVADVLAAMLIRFRDPHVRKGDLLIILDACNCRAFASALARAWGFGPAVE